MATESGGSIGRSDVDAARNRSFGAGLVDDPYPTYHRLIEQCAVLAGGISEHFGIPVIEAMAWGVPVITSDRSALAERQALELVQRRRRSATEVLQTAGICSEEADRVITAIDRDTALEPPF